jgi:predicted DNA-binding ribbon-helix-helix protein
MQEVPQTIPTGEIPLPVQDAKKAGNVPWKMRKRSVVIAGHRTSVSLEDAFWDSLKSIAGQRGETVNQIVTQIDSQRSGNLSRAIRLFVLAALKAA